MNASSNLCSTKPIVLLYGTTPLRLDAAPAEIEVAAVKLVERIKDLPLDALVVYDVQDESARVSEPRPFPFLPTMDARVTLAYCGRERDLKPLLINAWHR